jgi:hypothetical protein
MTTWVGFLGRAASRCRRKPLPSIFLVERQAGRSDAARLRSGGSAAAERLVIARGGHRCSARRLTRALTAIGPLGAPGGARTDRAGVRRSPFIATASGTTCHGRRRKRRGDRQGHSDDHNTAPLEHGSLRPGGISSFAAGSTEKVQFWPEFSIGRNEQWQLTCNLDLENCAPHASERPQTGLRPTASIVWYF